MQDGLDNAHVYYFACTHCTKNNKLSGKSEMNNFKGINTFLGSEKLTIFLLHFLKVEHFKSIVLKFHEDLSIIYGDIPFHTKRSRPVCYTISCCLLSCCLIFFKLPRKVSRQRRNGESNFQLSRPKKRKQFFNPKSSEEDKSGVSASAFFSKQRFQSR